MHQKYTFEERIFGIFRYTINLDKSRKILIQKELASSTKLPLSFISYVVSNIDGNKCVYEITQTVTKNALKFGLYPTPADVYQIIFNLEKKGIVAFSGIKPPEKILTHDIVFHYISTSSKTQITQTLPLPENTAIIIPTDIEKTISQLKEDRKEARISTLGKLALHVLLDRNSDVLFAMLVIPPDDLKAFISRKTFKVKSITLPYATSLAIWNAIVNYIEELPISNKINFILVQGNSGLVLIKGFRIHEDEYIIAVGCLAETSKNLSRLYRDILWIISELQKDLS